MDMKSLIDYGTSLTFYLGIIFIVIATLIYVRKRINDLDAKANSMFDIISTMAREIQYMKTVMSGPDIMSGGEGGGHPQGMNLESALNTDDNTRDVLMSHFQAGVTGDESSDDESSDDESGNDESGDDESGDDESGDDESGDDESDADSDNEQVIETIENIKFNTTSDINDIDEDDEVQDEDNQDDEGQDEDDEGQDENNENEENVKLIDFNENSIIDSELNDVDLTDYNKKTPKELKELVSTKGLATEVNRLKRPQLIKLLQKQP